VALTSRGLDTRAVLAELARRHGISGLAEKASRAPKATP
jgi:phosphoribosyl-ATP pyrophosphohydrolase